MHADRGKDRLLPPMVERALRLTLSGMVLAGCARASEDSPIVVADQRGLPNTTYSPDFAGADVDATEVEEASSSELIVNGEIGRDIWQIELEEGMSIWEAIDKIAAMSTWENFSASLVFPDRERVLHLDGGRSAVDFYAFLFDSGLATYLGEYGVYDYDPRYIPPESVLIIGDSAVEPENLRRLVSAESGLLSGADVLEVSFSGGTDGQPRVSTVNFKENDESRGPGGFRIHQFRFESGWVESDIGGYYEPWEAVDFPDVPTP